jgi:hypothetical protein
MSLTEIRIGLGTRLATILGLMVYHRAPSRVAKTPCVVILPRHGDYDRTMGGLMAHMLEVTVLVSLNQSHERAQAELDEYISATGTKSIKAAIETDRTLGGNAADCHVTRYYDYGGLEYAGVLYLGCRFEVEVYE